MALVTDGLCDWKNLGNRLKEQETFRKYAELEIFRNWVVVLIDEVSERLMRWNVFHHLFAIVQNH